MIIYNVKIYTSEHRFRSGSIEIHGKRITEVFFDDEAVIDMRCAAGTGERAIDGRGSYMIPGLIDMHLHGALGYDVCDGTMDAFRSIASYEVSCGVTGICPATLTLPVEQLCRILETGKTFSEEQDSGEKEENPDRPGKPGAAFLGFNMEGPFISPKRKGSQNEQYILPCDVKIAERFLDASGGLVRYIGLAPEENPDFEHYIRRMKKRVRISLAHTDADYETAMRAFRAGASHAVHLFNAMTGLSHRAPGVVGAVSDSGHVTAELICDGIHVHPAAVRAAFRMIGPERIIFISDSLSMTGLPDGKGMLGGLPVLKNGSRCTLAENGALAGSVTTLMDCMRNAVRTMGIPLETAVRCSSENPAKALGVFCERGSIEKGKMADLVFLSPDKDLEVRGVICEGCPVKTDDFEIFKEQNSTSSEYESF